MPATTTRWAGTVTARSSIAHGGETRGTITLLRRELIVQPDGHPKHVPIISGNAFRGRLRRVGEELLRDVLGYEGALPLPVAHALRGGGSLAKTSGTPLSGRRLHDLRALVPHVGVFGCAGGGRIVDGCLAIGKVVPHLLETAHIVAGAGPQLTAFTATQLESYVRADDTDAHAFAPVPTPGPVTVRVDTDGRPALDELPDPDGPPGTAILKLYRVETFPAGTRFSTWLQLHRATDLETAYFTDVLEAFRRDGRLGGRGGIGHGQVDLDLTRHILTDQPAAGVDWRAHLREHRAAALDALTALT